MSEYYLKYKKYKLKYLNYKNQIGGKKILWNNLKYDIDNTYKNTIYDKKAHYYGEYLDNNGELKTELSDGEWKDIVINEEDEKTNTITAKFTNDKIISKKLFWIVNKNDYKNNYKNSSEIDIKSEINIDISKLKFVYFEDKEKGKEKQKQYYNDNLKKILSLFDNCFPSNINKYIDNEDNKKNIIKQYKKYKEYDSYTYTDGFLYFATYKKNIVGFFNIPDNGTSVFKYNGDIPIKTYSLITPDDVEYSILNDYILNKGEKITINPYISSLCKDIFYTKIGKFLLDNISEHLKNKHNKIYLTAGSSTYNYLFDSCKLEKEKYLESNKKLLKYYESQNFIISKELYDVHYCKDSDNILVYNILCREI